MKHVSEINQGAATPPQTTQPTCSTSASSSRQRTTRQGLTAGSVIAGVFATFLSRYGYKWSQQWPTPDVKRLAAEEWRQQLSGLPTELIKHGLDTWEDEWPPSSTQFRKHCLGGNWEHRGQAYKVFPKALPAPKADPDLVKARLAEMRKNIRGGRSQTEQERFDGIERETRRLRELNGEAKR